MPLKAPAANVLEETARLFAPNLAVVVAKTDTLTLWGNGSTLVHTFSLSFASILAAASLATGAAFAAFAAAFAPFASLATLA
jgi:hypothetical protein